MRETCNKRTPARARGHHGALSEQPGPGGHRKALSQQPGPGGHREALSEQPGPGGHREALSEQVGPGGQHGALSEQCAAGQAGPLSPQQGGVEAGQDYEAARGERGPRGRASHGEVAVEGSWDSGPLAGPGWDLRTLGLPPWACNRPETHAIWWPSLRTQNIKCKIRC